MSSSFHHSSASSYSSIHSFIQPEPQQPFISSTLALISVLKSKKDSNPEKQKTASLGRYLLCSIAEPSGPQAYLVAAARTLVRASEPSLGCSTGAKWPHIASPQQPHSVSNEGRSESWMGSYGRVDAGCRLGGQVCELTCTIHFEGVSLQLRAAAAARAANWYCISWLRTKRVASGWLTMQYCLHQQDRASVCKSQNQHVEKAYEKFIFTSNSC